MPWRRSKKPPPRPSRKDEPEGRYNPPFDALIRGSSGSAWSPGAAPSDHFPLFDAYPQLAGALPRIALSAGPSPVQHLCRLQMPLGGRGQLWLKNDGLYGTTYGGNKPRKLEFVLADALARGAHTILTVGALGTHHGLATAVYGGQLGLCVALLLTYQQPDRSTFEQLCRMLDAGAELHYTGSLPVTAALAPYFAARYARRHGWQRPYVLWTGGSTPLGCVGYVNAALELAEQVRDGRLPEPATIVVPLGSAGTAAGLLLGLRLAGLNSRLVAAAVTRAPTARAGAVAALANATARLLARKGLDANVPSLRASDIDVVRGWLGDGYGRPSRAGEEAQALLADTEGLKLDSTYTAKAVAALIDLRRDGQLADGPVLYWHTYNAIPLEPPISDYASLPRAIQRVLRRAGAL